MQGDLNGGPASVLVTASGFCQNTHMGWKNAEKTTVGRDWGEAPTLVEGIPTRLTLPAAAERVEAWALDERGHRAARVPVEATEKGRAALTLGPAWRTLWYEVTLK